MFHYVSFSFSFSFSLQGLFWLALIRSHDVTCELRVEFGLWVLFSREKLFLSLCTPQRRFSALTVLFCHSESLSTCQALSSLVKPCQDLSSVKPCQALYSEGVCKPGALQLQARLPTWSMEPLVRHIACPRRNIALYNAYICIHSIYKSILHIYFQILYIYTYMYNTIYIHW